MELEMRGAVKERYSEGAKAQVPELCCPTSYQKELLENIPKEIIERDYGCGDPTPYIKEGDTVLDLGSGSGKICYIAAQVVGAEGKVIGVDMNDDMLELSRSHLKTFADDVGFANIEFRKGEIQDLALDPEAIDHYLKERPVNTAADYQDLNAFIETQKADMPLIASNSVDCVVSNCVLNLVNPGLKAKLFEEIFRVVKPGGMVAISDIVADEAIPEDMQKDEELWSGCISGALTETEFVDAFDRVGFYGMRLEKWDTTPWQTVNGLEFRPAIITAYKNFEGARRDHHQAVIYQGPFQETRDDFGNLYRRGERTAVSKRTFDALSRAPYKEFFHPVEPLKPVSEENAEDFSCDTPAIRSPRVTKGEGYTKTTEQNSTSCC